MRIETEKAARAISGWVMDPETDPEEIAAVLEFSFGVVMSAEEDGDVIIVTPEPGITEETLNEELEFYAAK
jgi:hypothetical protein